MGKNATTYNFFYRNAIRSITTTTTASTQAITCSARPPAPNSKH